MPQLKFDKDTTALCADESDTLDRADREDAIARALEAASDRDLLVDTRCWNLFQRYIDGDLTAARLVAEIKRPYLH